MNPKSKKQQRKINYINIQEARDLYLNGNNPFMETVRSAAIHETKNSKNAIRLYRGISEASILRLAKIQEKLAQ